MCVVTRPRFGRPCFDGCGEIVPTQRLNELARRAAERGDVLRPSDRICVDCERERQGGATVTRKPR